jgi:hypothetical protein
MSMGASFVSYSLNPSPLYFTFSFHVHSLFSAFCIYTCILFLQLMFIIGFYMDMLLMRCR